MAAPEQPSPRPALHLKETTQDGGTVEQGTQVQYRFTVANQGQADLELAQVKPECGCTVPRWDRVIGPAQEGFIEARLDTSSFRGPLRKHLTVVTNDPARPQIELTLAATVIPLIQVTPGLAARLSLDEQPVTQEFILERNGGRAMKITQVGAGVPFVTAEVTPLPGEGRFRVALTATAATPLGRSTVPVAVRTDLEKGVTVTLILTVERGIVTAPQRIFWSFTGGSVPLSVRSMVTLTRQDRPFQITGVSTDDPKLEAKLQTVRDGHEYRLVVIYSGGWEGEMLQRRVTVTTDDPKQPALTIPVQAQLPRPN